MRIASYKRVRPKGKDLLKYDPDKMVLSPEDEAILNQLVEGHTTELLREAEANPKDMPLKIRLRNDVYDEMHSSDASPWAESPYYKNLGDYLKAAIEKYTDKPYYERKEIVSKSKLPSLLLKFEKRINVSVRDEDEGKTSSNSGDWFLGVNNRNVGSIHSDYKYASAIELSDIEFVAVYPVIGWWKSRKYLGKIDSEARYSLIVSIETPDVETDLYSKITQVIENTLATTITIAANGM